MSNTTKFEKQTDLTYSFRISRRKLPIEVRNLWDLEVKTPSDEDWVKIVDADALSTILDKIGYIFEQDGL